jgi:hypothetical protein
MRLQLAAVTALAALAAAPAATAAPAGTTFPVDGSYKGPTGQSQRAQFKISGKRVAMVSIGIQRFCSDGTHDAAHVLDTDLAGQADAALRQARNGGWRFDVTVPASNGVTVDVKGTIRKGWLTGTVTAANLAGLPGFDVPAAGATCSTSSSETSNTVTFKVHFG